VIKTWKEKEEKMGGLFCSSKWDFSLLRPSLGTVSIEF